MYCPYTHVHLIGIGGIHVSAIAKLLLAQGVSLSGSDMAANEQTEELERRGVRVYIGHAMEQVPAEAQVIVFSSAANETNPERLEGMRRGLPAFNSHQFLGLLGKGMKQIVITGTHGKSTTTAMLALLAKACELDPTVVVGTRVPQLKDGNVEIGSSDWLIVEGDEFDHHFLSYHPTALVINNIEGDHFDIYPTLHDMVKAYRTLLARVVDGGVVVGNEDDEQVRKLLESEKTTLLQRGVKIVTVGTREGSDLMLQLRTAEVGRQRIDFYSAQRSEQATFFLSIPGAMNAMNALMCYAVGETLDWPLEKVTAGLASFQGIWRRLEKIGEKDGVTVFSDYGHHPTAVTKTLEAIKEFYPARRLVLCFQPHHRNRTKHLFVEFVACFDLADALVLSEIYDVKGRDRVEDQALSSKDLLEAIQERDKVRDVSRPLGYVAHPEEALNSLRTQLTSGDVLIVMGAGDIYKIAYALV